MKRQTVEFTVALTGSFYLEVGVIQLQRALGKRGKRQFVEKSTSSKICLDFLSALLSLQLTLLPRACQDLRAVFGASLFFQVVPPPLFREHQSGACSGQGSGTRSETFADWF